MLLFLYLGLCNILMRYSVAIKINCAYRMCKYLLLCHFLNTVPIYLWSTVFFVYSFICNMLSATPLGGCYWSTAEVNYHIAMGGHIIYYPENDKE